MKTFCIITKTSFMWAFSPNNSSAAWITIVTECFLDLALKCKRVAKRLERFFFLKITSMFALELKC